MSSWLRAGALMVGLVIGVAASCTAGSDGTGTGAAGGSGGAGGGDGGSGANGGSGGFIGDNCEPDCVPPQFCSVSGVCLDDGQCSDEGDCMPGAQCSEEGVCTGCTPPNMLIVLDRSCSMKDDVMGTPKWDLAVQALTLLTTEYVDEIRFGLTLFPDIDPPSCGQLDIEIPVGDGNEAAIQDLLAASLVENDPFYPDGPCVTNIDTAIEQAGTEASFNDTERPSYILLLTDGRQAGCNDAGGDNGTLQMITDYNQMRSIATFVVGFGGEVSPDDLNEFAVAGGYPANDASCMPDACQFYKAEDGTSLEAVLDAIAGQIHCDPEDPM
jgi:hypothetical protein